MAGQGRHLKLALSLNPGCLVTSPVTTARRLLFLFCWPCLILLYSGYYMVLLCQWLCHLCGELWYHTRAEGFTYNVSFTHTNTYTHIHTHIAFTCMVLLGSDDGREAETRNPVTMYTMHK
jgi:hypothetical protein